MVIDSTAFERELDVAFYLIQRDLESIGRQVAGAMGARFKLLCIENIGNSGETRPWNWAFLSYDYSRRVKRPHATMYLTGALERSIKFQAHKNYSEVWISTDDCVYALAHQFGEGVQPPRPYFPCNSSGVTPKAQEECFMAAEKMFDDCLSGSFHATY